MDRAPDIVSDRPDFNLNFLQEMAVAAHGVVRGLASSALEVINGHIW